MFPFFCRLPEVSRAPSMPLQGWPLPLILRWPAVSHDVHGWLPASNGKISTIKGMWHVWFMSDSHPKMWILDWWVSPFLFGWAKLPLTIWTNPCVEQLPGKRITNAGAKRIALMFLRIHQKAPTKSRPPEFCSDHVNDSSGTKETAVQL